MLYVFAGNDPSKVRHEAYAYVNTISKNDAEITSVTHESCSPGTLIELAQGASLFGSSRVIVLDTLSEDESTWEALLSLLNVLAESANHFVVIENELKAADAKKLEKNAKKMHNVESRKGERFNAFLMTDALLRRDKKSLWLLLVRAWNEGLSDEEVIGVLYWQIKALRATAKTKHAEETGLKPFVYSKAKRALSVFTQDEIDTLSRSLLSVYHDGHGGKVDTHTALEKWVLSL